MHSPHDQFASDYDQLIDLYECRIAEVLFGLCYKEVAPGDSLLDVGIGTGLSSYLFHLAGLQIFGIDGSCEMLKLCNKKGFAKELVQHNILDFPWPYQDAMIDHVISCGVFHFIEDLHRTFAEIHRIQKGNGLFAFTIMNADFLSEEQEKKKQRTIDGIPTFSHSVDCIHQLLNDHHYVKRREIVCFVGDTPFSVVCAQKQ